MFFSSEVNERAGSGGISRAWRNLMFSALGDVIYPVTRARLVERVHVPSVGASSLPPTLPKLCSNL